MNIRPWTTVGPGSNDGVVGGIQYLLRARGHAVPVDEAFGPATVAAVRAVQAAAGLPTDGIVGPNTWPHLVTQGRAGAHADAVRAVQQFALLRMPGDDPLAVDGAYGPVTAERVRFFQESWGLTQDGIAGEATWSFLSTLRPGATPWPLVSVGATQDSNWRVRAVQLLLRAHGATIVADGVFGPASGAAVNAYQQTLRATYISSTIGQLDWPALVVTVRRGDSGDAVRAAQTLLPGGLAIDGAFGPITETAVREFQTMFGLAVDGVVGPQTWHLLTLRVFD